MKQYVAVLAVSTAAICQAQPSSAGHPSPSDLRQVSVQKPVLPPSFTPRQLSAQERAELRRQLSQYSRLAGKGS